MRRRTIASFPILLAGIIMVLSFSIPHHHHKESVCFTITHCANNETENSCRHEHDIPTSTEMPCTIQALQQVDITRNSLSRQDAHTLATPDFIPFLSITAQWALEALILTGTTTEACPQSYRERLHSSEWHTTLIGRAPPKVTA